MFPLHQITHLTVHQTILRIKGTSDKINLMPYDPGSIQAMIIRAIGRRMKIRSIVNLIPHLLQNPHIVHLKLRKKAAHVGNQKGLADRYLPSQLPSFYPCSFALLLLCFTATNSWDTHRYQSSAGTSLEPVLCLLCR